MKFTTIARLALAGFMLILCETTIAQAAPEFYVSIIGAKQGPFKGEVVRKGLEGKIAGLNFEYAMLAPRDSATGLATGRRAHKPIKIVKAWGAASTQLFTAFAMNETLTSVVIDFFAIGPNGAMILDHTIKLTNAFVTSIEHRSDTLGPQATFPSTETVEFVSQQIELINHTFKTSAMDSWSAP